MYDDIKKYYLSFIISFIFDILHCIKAFVELHLVFFCGGAKVTSLMKLSVLTSLFTLCVRCLSPWARQNFPAPLKTKQTLVSINSRKDPDKLNFEDNSQKILFYFTYFALKTCCNIVVTCVKRVTTYTCLYGEIRKINLKIIPVTASKLVAL